MWYFYTLLVISIIYVIFMPKRLKNREMYSTWGIIAALGYTLDISLGIILDLYDLGRPGYQIYDILEDLAAGPALAIIYLNHMPVNKNKWIPYLIFWTTLSDCIEWGSVFTGYERLEGWTPWYSIPIYLAVYIFLRWHIKFLREKEEHFN